MATEKTLEMMIVATGHVYEVVSPPNGPFDKSLAALPAGFELWLPEQLASIRMSVGPKHKYSREGSRVAAEYCHDNQTGDILIAKRPHMTILKNLIEVTKAHREDREFYIPTEAWAELKDLAKEHPEDAMKTGVLLVKRKDIKPKYLTNRLAQEAVPYFLFGNQAQLYGNWLSENIGTEMPQHVIDANQAKKEARPFIRVLFVGDLSHRSELYCYLHLGSRIDRVRGIREVSLKPAADFSEQQKLELEEFYKKNSGLHAEMAEKHLPAAKEALVSDSALS